MNAPDFSDWLEFNPYAFSADVKSHKLTKALVELTKWHSVQCESYQKILNVLVENTGSVNCLEDIPFIPVRLFKEFDLLSIESDEVFKIMTSSGTSGQQVSKIYLDRKTAALQTKVLSRLMSDVLGKKRLPMLIIDSPSILKNRQAFSARGAGILGFSMFGLNVTYALDDSMSLDMPAIEAFLARHHGSPVFIFGFTFVIWQHFVLSLQKKGIHLPLDKGIVVHGGGWKKLQEQSVDNDAFRHALKSVANVNKVVNYYGMVEQTGSLFVECEFGHLHAPIYADVIFRRPIDFGIAEVGEEGIIEVLSLLPCSYPGHALLTEDLGVLLGVDDCRCQRLGKYFRVIGRLEKAEMRGCSDTYETRT
ncbi:MAG: acyl-protein synthetase [Gammaproteobacteria bacterium]|nr:acyl-protein synthetase [Gammaproteobacteria bacterium]